MDGDTATVLLVENEPDLAELYASWLEDAYRVETVRDGAEAHSAVADGVDVVVLDGRPADADVEPDALVRDPRTRVVVMTGAEPDSPNPTVDEVLLKPVSRAELRSSVENQLLRRTYAEQLEAYFELASKRATLHGRLSEAERRSSQEYAELEDRIAVLRTEVDETRARLLERDDPEQLYRDVSAAPDTTT
ncbi:HalX domain-containing protein [Natronococcus jeotgali]|uniref:Response regulator receiver protein n=1 Tax=Natronococcus jeotgali DSM 18795 TaxID=1227498 RepID=L9WW96_9EURY|nr:HalX domain-containing protein [Natronococcus jeotgali]ELY53730.1 response regulator receiver protein [Natronococcus jeotgali DSM 18795]